MYSILQSRYQRVEKALDTLLESITAYNPSLSAADELVAADNSVNEALDQLAVHHANYAQILSLRATSALLDEQIQSTLRSLADTRATLKSITLTSSAPAMTSLPAPREVKVHSLLSYAKFISKTTVPPTRRGGGGEVKTEPVEQVQVQSEGQTPAEGAGQSDAPRKVLPPEVKGQFIPWPGHEVVARGALADIQRMREGGRDPGLVTEVEDEKVKEEKEEQAEKVPEVETQNQQIEVPRTEPVQVRQREEDVFDPDEM